MARRLRLGLRHHLLGYHTIDAIATSARGSEWPLSIDYAAMRGQGVPRKITRLTRNKGAGRYNLRNQRLWQYRARAAVDLWLQNSASRLPRTTPLRVTDLGAGGALVGALLADRATYLVDYRPYDLLPQSKTVTRLDVRAGLPSARADLTFCLGLLEYLPAEDPIIGRLLAHSRYVITSYVGFEASSISLQQRLALQWQRHQTHGEFQELFIGAGFSLLATVVLDPTANQRLWLWEGPARPVA